MYKKTLFYISLTLSFAGCAATSVFLPYTSEAAKYKNALVSNSPAPALTSLESKTNGADKLLYLSERGRIYQVTNQFEASKADFERAIAIYTKREDRARISATSVAADSASLLTNDNALPYRGQDFERVFLYQFQAFNYLAENDPSGAGVELRRAALEQRNLELENERATTAAENQARDNNIQLPDTQRLPQLEAMNTLVGNVKSAFQNAYTFYVSAVIWEAMGERNSALVDYKKALEINPQNKSLQKDVKRLDSGLNSSPHASLIVLYEDGFIPERKAFTFTVPDFHNNKTYSIAFPYYSPDNWYHPTPLSITFDNVEQGRTELIANFGAMAVKSLKDKVPGMLVRQILRGRVKYEMQAQAQEADPAAGFITTLYNIISEQADLRTWLTLPNNAQIKRIETTGGEHSIQISTAVTSMEVPISLIEHRTTILRVFNFNNRLDVQHFQL